MRVSLAIILLFLSVSTNAQLFDSIKNAFNYKPKPLVSLETRNAFITNSLVKVRAIKAGVSFNNTVRIGLSYNWLKDDTASSFDSTKNVKLNYVAPFFEYTFYKDQRFAFAIPIKLGFGSAFYKNDKDEISDRQFVATYEPAMLAEVRFLRYFAVGGGVGLRLMLKDNRLLREQLNSPIYIFGFKIYFDTLKEDFIR
ncbi:MAG: hypothetical protein ACLGGV_07970 [Bacteroidia bacterium]